MDFLGFNLGDFINHPPHTRWLCVAVTIGAIALSAQRRVGLARIILSVIAAVTAGGLAADHFRLDFDKNVGTVAHPVHLFAYVAQGHTGGAAVTLFFIAILLLVLAFRDQPLDRRQLLYAGLGLAAAWTILADTQYFVEFSPFWAHATLVGWLAVVGLGIAAVLANRRAAPADGHHGDHAPATPAPATRPAGGHDTPGGDHAPGHDADHDHAGTGGDDAGHDGGGEDGGGHGDH